MGSCAGIRAKQKKQKTVDNEEVEFRLNLQESIFFSQGGDEFNKLYKMGKKIKEGTWSKIRECEKKDSLRMLRAVKIVDKNMIDEQAKVQLNEEINILKDLSHPNVLKLFESYQNQKKYYLVTELLDGKDLFDTIAEKKRFTELTAATIIKQVLAPIAYLHSLNIVHRDIKPENYVYESESAKATLKLIDFGNSTKIKDNTDLTEKLGNPYYVAPEVLEEKYNEKCDVWSAGVILYTLLVGRLPFNGRTYHDILLKLEKGEYNLEGQMWTKISFPAKNLVSLMLEKDVEKRITAYAALRHIWIQSKSFEDLDIEYAHEYLNNLKNFMYLSHLQMAVLQFIITHLVTNHEKANVQQTFRALDSEGDGQLSKEDILNAYANIFGPNKVGDNEVNAIFKQVDVDGNGFIDNTDFLLAVMDKYELVKTEKLRQAFNMFDKDGSGSIEASEIKELLGKGRNFEDKVWAKMIRMADLDGDETINYGEFKYMMQKILDAQQPDHELLYSFPIM